jgi:hypothetical protein
MMCDLAFSVESTMAGTAQVETISAAGRERLDVPQVQKVRHRPVEVAATAVADEDADLRGLLGGSSA